MTIIDAHSHLWLKQDTCWNGRVIRSKANGRADFLGEEVQMIPPFIIDGRNTAEIFLSNMDYAQVSAAVVVQELIDGCQNNYLREVKKAYPAYFGTYAEFDKVKAYLDSYSNLFCVGRNGQHRYNNMDHYMVTAMVACEGILQGVTDKSALWEVNTEKSYHETKQN